MKTRNQQNTPRNSPPLLLSLHLLFVLLVLIACAESSDDSGSSPATNSGVFLDAAVEGITSSSGGVTTLTDANGTFTYTVGQTVSFSIGNNVSMGSGTPAATMFPMDIVSGGRNADGSPNYTNSAVINIARFLQTLDVDLSPNNGITLTPAVVTAVNDTVLASGNIINFTLSPTAFGADPLVTASINAAGSALNTTRTLVSSNTALGHLVTTYENTTLATTATGATAVPANHASGISFPDADPVRGQITGLLSITAAATETDIQFYNLYWGSSATTVLGPQITSLKKGGSLAHLFNSDLLPIGATHFLVFTANEIGEATTPTALAIVDVATAAPIAAAGGIAFQDSNPATGLLGGSITVTPATDERSLTHYAIYFGNSAGKTVGASPITTLPAVGANVSHVLTDNTSLPAQATHFWVYTQNGVVEMTSGMSVAITDLTQAATVPPTVTASSLSFVDTNSTPNLLTGTVNIGPAAVEDNVTHYAVYFANSSGTGGTLLGESPTNNGGNVSFPLDNVSIVGIETQFLWVYTRNSAGEATTGISSNRTLTELDRKQVFTQKPIHLAKAVSFTDTNTSSNAIAGTIVVTKADNESDLQQYALYFGSSTAKSTKITELTKTGSNLSHPMSATSFTDNTSYIWVYSKNDAGESENATITAITDIKNTATLVIDNVTHNNSALSSSSTISGIGNVMINTSATLNNDNATLTTTGAFKLSITTDNSSDKKSGNVTVSNIGISIAKSSSDNQTRATFSTTSAVIQFSGIDSGGNQLSAVKVPNQLGNNYIVTGGTDTITIDLDDFRTALAWKFDNDNDSRGVINTTDTYSYSIALSSQSGDNLTLTTHSISSVEVNPAYKVKVSKIFSGNHTIYSDTTLLTKPKPRFVEADNISGADNITLVLDNITALSGTVKGDISITIADNHSSRRAVITVQNIGLLSDGDNHTYDNSTLYVIGLNSDNTSIKDNLTASATLDLSNSHGKYVSVQDNRSSGPDNLTFNLGAIREALAQDIGLAKSPLASLLTSGTYQIDIFGTSHHDAASDISLFAQVTLEEVVVSMPIQLSSVLVGTKTLESHKTVDINSSATGIDNVTIKTTGASLTSSVGKFHMIWDDDNSTRYSSILVPVLDSDNLTVVATTENNTNVTSFLTTPTSYRTVSANSLILNMGKIQKALNSLTTGSENATFRNIVPAGNYTISIQGVSGLGLDQTVYDNVTLDNQTATQICVC